jgi:hypothetical protein
MSCFCIRAPCWGFMSEHGSMSPHVPKAWRPDRPRQARRAWSAASKCSIVLKVDKNSFRQRRPNDLKIRRSHHRSHFGSRYKLGCCVHAGLFSPRFNSQSCSELLSSRVACNALAEKLWPAVQLSDNVFQVNKVAAVSIETDRSEHLHFGSARKTDRCRYESFLFPLP